MLYSLVAVAPVLVSSKFRAACERPSPKAKAGGAGAAGMAGRGGGGAGSTGGATAAADPCSLAVVVLAVRDERVELVLR